MIIKKPKRLKDIIILPKSNGLKILMYHLIKDFRIRNNKKPVQRNIIPIFIDLISFIN